MSPRLRLPAAARNPISLLGAAIATVMAVLFFVLFILEWFGYLTNPYIGLLVFVTVPVIWVAGLLLIPLGAWWYQRRLRLHPDQPIEWPVVDLRKARHRAVLFGVLVLTMVNVGIVAMASYGGVHYMDSAEFCGTTCHTSMEPQYVAWQANSHARVECARCHIGPGAGAFVQAKLAGARQLAHVLTNQVPKPVPSPDHLLRPARDTCEQCHWPAKFTGDLVRVVREYSRDEMNSESVTTLQMHVGGGSSPDRPGRGIHWHMSADTRIEFAVSPTDPNVVPYVRVTDQSGQAREYFGEKAEGQSFPAESLRRMDCMDCHNRPSHTFAPSAARAVDVAMGQGRIPKELPFARREVETALTADYPDRAAALAGIEKSLRAFYQGRAGTDPALVTRAVSGAQETWTRNVFPAMKVTWGTYTNQSGHVDTPGCFRCHDDSHKTREGRAISQDCDLCHTIATE